MALLEMLTVQTDNPADPAKYFKKKHVKGRYRHFRDWALSQLSVAANMMVLDIGCGDGETIQELASVVELGEVHGIDVSEASVKAARKKNKAFIDEERVEIHHAEVSFIPYGDDYFDLIIAVDSHIFWPDLDSDFAEVKRVLKPDALFMCVTDIYKNEKFEKRNSKYRERMDLNYMDVYELKSLFQRAGFHNILIKEESDKGWIMGWGRK